MAVQIELEDDQALVLFELVETLKGQARHLGLGVAETFSLDQLQAAMEPSLMAILSPDYESLLRQAREAIESRVGT